MYPLPVFAAETTTHHGSWLMNSNSHSQQGSWGQGYCPVEVADYPGGAGMRENKGQEHTR